MKILTFFWIFFAVLIMFFPLIIALVENNFDEEHPFMKWWRKHIVSRDPEDDIHK